MQRNRFLSLLLSAAVLLAAAPTAAASLAPAVSSTVNRASMALETSYYLRTRLSYYAGTIAATETIRIRNLSGLAISKINLSVLPRAFGELASIGGYSVDGRVVSAAWTNNANLELQLGRDLPPGEYATVRLSFTLRPSSRIGTSLDARLSKANGIMQVSHWFPIVSSGHGMRYPGDSQYTRTARRIRLELTTDSSAVRIAAPGRRVSSSGTYHVYELEYARDFAFGASPLYRSVSGAAGGVSINAYYTSGNGPKALEYAKAVLVRFESAYGEYQWPRFVIAQTGRASSGNEYPGIVFLGGPLFSSLSTIAHETAHQWWYGMAGNDQLREPWLDEGLAEFSADHFYGGFSSYASSRPVNSSIYEFPNIPAPETSDDPDSYDQTVYFKASRFVNALRLQMGNARFFDAMRSLFAANRNGVITTREFYETMARYGASRTYMSFYIRL
ncbi:MAG TPA: M1 family aminopeptidase [Candidatus Limnocylindrales bacterium]|nr:M1 family aminopeptidase [Candidatus Limnocylindrales bacterium]